MRRHKKDRTTLEVKGNLLKRIDGILENLERKTGLRQNRSALVRTLIDRGISQYEYDYLHPEGKEQET